MTPSSWAVWGWIPIVLAAEFAQTARNAAQRSISGLTGPVGAALVRFLYGLPFLLTLQMLSKQPLALPSFTASYLAWLAFGALAHIAATTMLLLAMKVRIFVVAVIYSKTEVVQVALLAFIFLNESLSFGAVVALGAVALGVAILSVSASSQRGLRSSWFGASTAVDIASGIMFALAVIGYRGAAIELFS